MKIIPVIDYMQGQVVLAKSGQRSSYQPVKSLLCPSANLNDVVENILSLTDFNTIYIDIIINSKSSKSPETFGTSIIWQKLYEYASYYYNKYKNENNIW